MELKGLGLVGGAVQGAHQPQGVSCIGEGGTGNHRTAFRCEGNPAHQDRRLEGVRTIVAGMTVGDSFRP